MAVTRVTIRTEYIEGDGYRVEIKKGEDVLLSARQLTKEEAIALIRLVAERTV